ncbi:MAG: 50S ribosomal protein L4 [Pseudonocardiales bacterium]|nr:MAG: 50S ribosomal protein L4 [Pseudonocardiales bacterium]
MTLSLTVQSPADAESGSAKSGAKAGAKAGKVELPAEIFDVPTNVSLIHQVVVAQLAAARQGTASTKTRGEVRGGGKKPYRQKGTGRARQGSTRAPQFVGGGVVHGPRPRSYDQRTPKKMKVAALRGALSDRARNDRLFVVSSLVTGDAPSTKNAAATLAKVSTARHVLVVAERTDEITWKSLRNISTVHLLEPGQLNTYDVLISDEIVFTKSALDVFLAGPIKGKSAKASASSAEVDELVVADEAVEAEPVGAEATPAKAAKLTKKPATADVTEKADVTEQADDTEVADAPDYGPDSHLPLDDDAEPAGFPIKGNASSMLYHVPGSAFYKRTIAEVWFRTAEAAEAAGFELPPSQRGKAASEEEDN